MVLPIPLLFALALPSTVLSSPLNVMKTHALADSVHVPLLRRSDLAAQSGEQALARAREVIRQKYGVPDALEKRQSVSQVALYNLFADAEYTGLIDVGTPPTPFEVIIDTGSSDLWISTAPCTGCDTDTPLYNPSSSSTSGSSSTPFSIVYGSGDAAGTLAQDSVSIGGFTVQKQVFAAVTNSTNVVSGSVTGILGAGWESLATSGATPILQALAQGNAWPEQSFSFAFTRFANVANAYSRIEPGGILTLGGTNSSLFTGTMNYVPITDSGSYWLIPLQSITVGGVSVFSGGDSDSVAVDTGTSLIGGPPSAIQAIYGAIPNSRAVQISGQSGYWAYPCATQVKVAMTFGGIAYDINPIDFNAGVATSNGATCLGAFFEVETSRSSPDWIVGATFLKNVYTSFRFSPNPAVGFATLSSAAANLNDVKVTLVSSALGAASTGSSGSGSSGGGSTSPAPVNVVPRALTALLCTALAVALAA